MVMLDPLSTVFAEVAKGKQAINMALLPVTEAGQPGYEVERAVLVKSFHRPGQKSFILHLRIRGRKVKVWSRREIDALLQMGFFPIEKQHYQGRVVELIVFDKRPGKGGTTHVSATLRSRPAAQLGLLSTSETPEKQEQAPAAPSYLNVLLEEIRAERALPKPPPPPVPTAAPVQPALTAELDDEMPEHREVQVAPHKTSMQLFWRGAPYANEAELQLGQALARINCTMQLGTGLTHIPNGSLVLRASRKLHRKPDFIVILAEDGYQVMGVVEVDGSAHNGRHLGDEEKQNEFEDNGIVQIKRISAESVLADPNEAATRVLTWLRQIRRTGITINSGTEADF